eukprot:TRINITY_DN43589_c0_g1_i1.p1 TRINITY_DN43589_c0_g1~~TRINITY_DN43589_c0_g1_i1.p1  ORF type:complete len:398 (-),score=91.05 TRINITY_DN43589_c0_g1_i1:82-1236(-)
MVHHEEDFDLVHQRPDVSGAQYRKYRDYSRPQIWAVPAHLAHELREAAQHGELGGAGRRSQRQPEMAARTLNFRGHRSSYSPSDDMSIGSSQPPSFSRGGLASHVEGHNLRRRAESAEPDILVFGSGDGRSSATPSLPSQPPRPASQQATPSGRCAFARNAATPRSVTPQATGVAMASASLAVPAAMLGKLISPPWGPERANQDNPSWDVLHQRKLEYRQMLDEQYAKKADQLRKREEESSALDQNTVPTLATKTHKWGAPPCDKPGETALAKELLDTILKRRGKAHQTKLQEQMMQKAWMQESGRDRAKRFLNSKSRQREELSQLQGDWKQAAEDRRRKEAAERKAELDAEREAMKTVAQGMRPPRRLRKPRVHVYNVPNTAR